MQLGDQKVSGNVDDRLQQLSQGRVVPESFTHGTSEQRMRRFKRGMDSGRPRRIAIPVPPCKAGAKRP